jgi:hypothetical protein
MGTPEKGILLFRRKFVATRVHDIIWQVTELVAKGLFEYQQDQR